MDLRCGLAAPWQRPWGHSGPIGAAKSGFFSDEGSSALSAARASDPQAQKSARQIATMSEARPLLAGSLCPNPCTAAHLTGEGSHIACAFPRTLVVAPGFKSSRYSHSAYAAAASHTGRALRLSLHPPLQPNLRQCHAEW
jgi:hypothetical protein